MNKWEVICNDMIFDDGIVTARLKIHGGWLVTNQMTIMSGLDVIGESSSLVFVPDVHHFWKITND